VLESWGILTLQLLAVASFASLMAVLIGRWAILPTFLFFVVLGNSASGGAVAPPLLPPPFAFVSQWLPSGATVTALREAVYFPTYQHAHPIVVLATWATVLFAAMLVGVAPAAQELGRALNRRRIRRGDVGGRARPEEHPSSEPFVGRRRDPPGMMLDPCSAPASPPETPAPTRCNPCSRRTTSRRRVSSK
jgi:hypothetical protein